MQQPERFFASKGLARGIHFPFLEFSSKYFKAFLVEFSRFNGFVAGPIIE
jgi:hypothetical protein